MYTYEPNWDLYFPEVIADETLVQNEPFSVVLPEALGGSGSYEYTITPALPDGLMFSPETRTLSGTPTTASPETEYTYTATDTTSSDRTGDLTFSFFIDPASVTPEILYESAMTAGVVDTGDSVYGYRAASEIVDSDTPVGSLGSVEFTHGGQTYTIVDITTTSGATGPFTFKVQDAQSSYVDLTTLLPDGSIVIQETGTDEPLVEIPFAVDELVYTTATGLHAIVDYTGLEYLNDTARRALERFVFNPTENNPVSIKLYETSSILVQQDISDKTFMLDIPVLPFSLPEAIGGSGDLHYYIAGLPAGFKQETDGRTISGTPAEGGIYEITYTVLDSGTLV